MSTWMQPPSIGMMGRIYITTRSAPDNSICGLLAELLVEGNQLRDGASTRHVFDSRQ
jgi:hypothetical protein